MSCRVSMPSRVTWSWASRRMVAVSSMRNTCPSGPRLRISRPRYRLVAMSRAGATASVWNTVSMPASLACCTLRKWTGWPSRYSWPSSGMSAPHRHRIRVDLPALLSPMTARISPGYSSKSAPRSASTRPSYLTQHSAASPGSAPFCVGGRAESVTVSPARRKTTARSSSYPPDPLVDGDGRDDQQALGQLLGQLLHPGQGQAGLEHLDDQRPEQRAEHHPPAAEQADAADDHGGDAVQVEGGGDVGAGVAHPADLDPGGHGVDQPGQQVHADQQLGGADADQPGGFGVVTDRVDVLAPGGPAQHVPDDQVQRQHDEHADGDLERPEADDVAGPQEQVARLRGQGLAVGVLQPGRGEHAQGAQGGDARRP